MTEEVLKTVVQVFAKEARKVYEDSLYAVILYGSCARGDFEPDSDIDLFILLDVAPEQVYDERRKAGMFSDRLELEYDVVLSLVIQSVSVYERCLPVSAFFQNIEKEGVKVA